MRWNGGKRVNGEEEGWRERKIGERKEGEKGGIIGIVDGRKEHIVDYSAVRPSGCDISHPAPPSVPIVSSVPRCQTYTPDDAACCMLYTHLDLMPSCHTQYMVCRLAVPTSSHSGTQPGYTAHHERSTRVRAPWRHWARDMSSRVKHVHSAQRSG